ncbi:MAG: hypothetical protein IPP35_12245 [Elusimicrobia bacterium]|nr:hypothetical protein [Elusimicrobiota bacterium]
MRIVYFGNNNIGWKVLRWLREQGEEIVGLVVHPSKRAIRANEMTALVDPRSCRVFDGSSLRDPEVQQALKALRPTLGVSVSFGYLLRKEILDLFPRGCVNLHPGFLPFNRGSYPNVWTLVEGTPAGVTLHYMDEGVDTGDIISQRPVAKEPWDTGGSLYHRLEAESLRLFQESWGPLKDVHKPSRAPQEKGKGTLHRMSDVEMIDEIHLEKNYLAKDLINILRARTFPPHPGAYFRQDGRKIYLRLQLLEELNLEGKGDNANVDQD